MVNVLIRDLPDETHAELRRRAERDGKSLQQYLVGELKRLAARPTIEDVLDWVETRSGGRVGARQAVADLTEERENRELRRTVACHPCTPSVPCTRR